MSRPLKLVSTLLLLVFTMPLLLAGSREIGKYLGLIKVSVPVVGTGSMYPSLFWEEAEGGPDNAQNKVIEEYRTTPRMYHRYSGFTLFGQTYLRREIGLGDMVTFESDTTRQILAQEGKDHSAGFIKRVVGLPGDRLELRDGYLKRNGELILEPYIYRPRSTYGDSFLSDCQLLTVPEEHYFVMGDNRKLSSDSRGELGLVADQDISFVLPLADQRLYQALWRDPSHDQDLAGTPTLLAKEFYQLVNRERESLTLPSLTPRPQLEESARLKAGLILAGNSDYPLQSAMAQAGYHNITTAELFVRGRFTAEELVKNIFYFDSTRERLLDEQMEELGIFTLNQQVDHCPTQVVVVHLGGYIPASYQVEVLESWQNLADSLQEVIPSWQQAKNYPHLDQGKLSELLTIFARRLTLAQEIVGVMQRREWLSKEQLARIEADSKDADRADQLTGELNR